MEQEEHHAQSENEEAESRNQSVAEEADDSKEQGENEEEEEVEAEAEAEAGEEEEEEEEDDDDDEQEGIQPGQAEAAEQVIEDDDKENEAEPADDGVRPKKKTELDLLLERQYKERQKNRKKKGDSEDLNEMDNIISAIITEMKQVAADDRVANEKSMPALKKLKMLPTVMTLLHKSDYHAAMIELGMLGAITEWLMPLPDRSLPNIRIREDLIEALKDFGEINADYLKSSGVGKAVMFLFKHPKEIKTNKQKLEKLIHNWSRPIFNLDNSFKQLTKEERLARDIEHVKSMKRRSNENAQNPTVDEALTSQDKLKASKKARTNDGVSVSDSLRPGDPGFCPRARVPVPSAKDYIIRPKSNIDNVENQPSKKPKKSETRLDKHQKRFVEITKNAKTSRAVNLSVTGGK